jgi:hypothetical protein
MAKKYVAILVAAIAMISASATALAVSRAGVRNPVDAVAGYHGAVNTLVAPAPAPGVDSAAGTSTSLAYPNIGGFEPGPPPYGSGGDGLSAFGVAFKEIPAPAANAAPASASPDADLIHSAYADALKRAQALAAGSGVSLGKLVSLNDYAQVQPFFKSCPAPVPMPGKPVPGAPNGSGSGATTVAPPIEIACTSRYYMVVWVMARYQLG